MFSINSLEYLKDRRVWGAAVVVVYLVITLSVQRFEFGINMTPSLPNWGFFTDKSQTPKRGDYVKFTPYENEFYDGDFVKRLVGMPGDQIENRDNQIYLSGELIGFAKSISLDGKKLTPISTQIIPDGYVFVTSDHKDSFDSRYEEVGLIPLYKLQGVSYPIL